MDLSTPTVVNQKNGALSVDTAPLVDFTGSPTQTGLGDDANSQNLPSAAAVSNSPRPLKKELDLSTPVVTGKGDGASSVNTAPEVTELLKHRARDELRARGGRPKRPTTADRLRRMHDAVTQDVDLKFAWRDKMKFKLDFIKELYDQSVISWQTAHSRQAKIMGEMDRTGVPTFGLGYAYNI